MNAKTAFLAVLAIVVVFGGGYYLYANSQDTSDAPAMTDADDSMMEEKDDSMMEDNSSYTLSQVAEHDKADDCWFVINDKVYDVTEYIAAGIHPGGEAILNGCGTDATEMFFNRPNGSGSHSEKAQNFSKTYIIGSLAKE